MRLTHIGDSAITTEYVKHSHKNFEITLVLQGEMNITLNGECFKVSDGDVILIPPNIDHQGTEGKDYINVFLQANDLDFYDKTVIHDYDGSIRYLFLILKKVMSEKEANYISISERLLDTICEYIKKYLKSNFKYDFVVNIKNKIYDNLSNSDFSIVSNQGRTL